MVFSDNGRMQVPQPFTGTRGSTPGQENEAKAQRQDRAQQAESSVSEEISLSLQEPWEVTEDALKNKNSSETNTQLLFQETSHYSKTK